MGWMRTARNLCPWIVPAILAIIHEVADYYRKEIAQLRVIARVAAITAEFWLRSKHGT